MTDRPARQFPGSLNHRAFYGALYGWSRRHGGHRLLLPIFEMSTEALVSWTTRIINLEV